LAATTLSPYAEFLYKTMDYWMPAFERCIRWDDPKIGIDWPMTATPLVSEKDRLGSELHQAEVFA
jgi:dTDP-4-dehydrorhamnose 3,5-epimerase